MLTNLPGCSGPSHHIIDAHARHCHVHTHPTHSPANMLPAPSSLSQKRAILLSSSRIAGIVRSLRGRGRPCLLSQGGARDMWILRVDMSNRTYRLEDVPSRLCQPGRAWSDVDHRARRGAAVVPSAWPEQQTGLRAGHHHRQLGAHLGTRIGGHQIPAHRRHQGGQRRLLLGTVSGFLCRSRP